MGSAEGKNLGFSSVMSSCKQHGEIEWYGLRFGHSDWFECLDHYFKGLDSGGFPSSIPLMDIYSILLDVQNEIHLLQAWPYEGGKLNIQCFSYDVMVGFDVGCIPTWLL